MTLAQVTPATYPHLLHQLSSLAGGRLVALLEGGYCLESLAEAAALSLRQLLGDRCPEVPGGAASAVAAAAIRATVTALRPYWRSLAHWETVEQATLLLSDPEEVFRPDLSFRPPAGWPPVEFPTRDYYLVYTERQAQHWRARVAALALTTPLPAPEEQLVLAYDAAMERHRDDEPHPECPERTARIWAGLEEAGLVGREGVVRVEVGRRLAREEAELVHESEHWQLLQDQQAMEQGERDELAERLNSIYLNSSSLDCALLAAGAVLEVVDRVLAGGGAGMAVVRPPGHHAEPHTPHGFCLFNNVAIAAQHAVMQHGLARVLILDWDVHHGNGIQHIFYESSNVLYISLHR